MEPPDARAGARRAPRLLVLALLLAAPPGSKAEVRLSVPPLVEVMRGESVTLDCSPLGTHDYFMLEWFLVDRSGARHRLASAELRGSELRDKELNSRGRSPPYQLDSQGRLVLPEAQVGDERDYVCVVKAGAAGTAEATARLKVFAKPEAPEVSPNKGILSVMDDFAQEIATCSSRNGNPAPQIMWYRNGQPLAVPLEVNSEGYMTTRTVREASGLLSLTSTLYLRLHKPDREASFHCSVHYSLPAGQHGRLDGPSFSLTLHYPTEHVLFWLGSQSTAEGWVREGDSVQLLCQGDGSPTPEYTFFWLQDKQEDVLKTSLEGNLTLERVQRNQSGTYGCRVEDFDVPEDAELSKTLELRVACESPQSGRGPWHQRSPHPRRPPAALSPTLSVVPSLVSMPLAPPVSHTRQPETPFQGIHLTFPYLEPAVSPQSSGDKTHMLHPSLQDPPGWPHLRRTLLPITPQALLLFPTVTPHLLFHPIPTHLSDPSLPRSLLGPPAHKP